MTSGPAGGMYRKYGVPLKGICSVDLALARRIELTDAWVGAESARMHAHIAPDCGAASFPIPGGCAVIRGMGSPRTQVLGLGMEGSVTTPQLDEIEEFFRGKNSQLQVDLCPFTDRSVPLLLASSGYTLEGFTNVLVRKLPTLQPAAESVAGVTVEQCLPHEADLWAQTVIEGFVGTGAALEENTAVLRSLFQQPGTIGLVARVDGVVGGAGAFSVREHVAAMYGASTLPAYRRKGVQTAIFQAVMRQAIDMRCDVTYTITEPGSTSQRNLERLDFRTAYTRSIMVKRFFPGTRGGGAAKRKRGGGV